VRTPLRSVAHAARLAGTFLRISTLNELQYRVNFVFSLAQSAIAVGTSLAVLGLVFAQTDSLRGWSAGELLVVMGVYVLMGGVIRAAIQPNMQQLMTDVQEGTLDYVLTKPADGQLLVSARRFQLWQAVDVLVGAGLVVFATARLPGSVGVPAVLGFLLALILGAVAIYCFWLILTIGAFWVTRVDFIIELFDGMYQAGRWPVTVYPGWLRVGFTFLVPLAFAITVPASALTGRFSAGLLAGAAAFTATLVAGTRWAWRRGLRRYSGASA
jgi:ABC-2 type transport system permease protein